MKYENIISSITEINLDLFYIVNELNDGIINLNNNEINNIILRSRKGLKQNSRI